MGVALNTVSNEPISMNQIFDELDCRWTDVNEPDFQRTRSIELDFYWTRFNEQVLSKAFQL
jgi:hypothetical protein